MSIMFDKRGTFLILYFCYFVLLFHFLFSIVGEKMSWAYFQNIRSGYLKGNLIRFFYKIKCILKSNIRP